MAFLQQRGTILSIAIILMSYFLGISGLASPFSYTGFSQFWSQKPLSSGLSEPQKFSVGFSLQSSYGAVAIIFDNGTTTTHKLDGDASYREVMSRLSLESSRHLAPPYEDPADAIRDNVRCAKRTLRKSIGLPATDDVGVLASLLRSLRSHAEDAHNIKITSAVLAVSHLVALYQDDVQDAFAYLGLNYVEPDGYFRPVIWENAAAYAGYGMGLCEHWDNVERCKEEKNAIPLESVFAVHYSDNALMSAYIVLGTATSLWEPEYRHIEDFELGYEKLTEENKEEYWQNVKESLQVLLIRHKRYKRPTKIVLTGDRVEDETFLTVLREAVGEFVDEMPQIWADGADVVAARGAAEFRRRKGV